MRHTLYILLLGVSLATLVSCDDDNGGTSTGCTSTIERGDLLSAWQETAIATLTTANQDVIMLLESIDQLQTRPGPINLNSVRVAFNLTQVLWAVAEPYAYGPDGDNMSYENINSFPLNEDELRDQLLTSDYNVSDATVEARGLPALEFLLFGYSESEIISRLLDDTDNYGALLAAHALELSTQISALQTAWNTSGTTFTDRTGTAAGDGFSVIINALSRHFEDARRDRLATPAGITTLGIPNPGTVQAPNSQQSLILLRVAIEVHREAFTVGSPSVKDYLDGLPGEEAASLVSDILAVYDSSLTATRQVDEPLQDAVTNDTDDVNALYRELSKQVINFKTDLPAVTCVSITYIDNPSDSD